MKKFFQYLGIICLVSFSFFYTEKTVNVVKELDDIMIKIKEEQNFYKVEPIDAHIVKNSIIPGISGKEINIDKSYQKMRRLGKFNANLLEYKKTKPTISLKNNKNKYIISGNKTKKMVSLIFLVDSHNDINNILQILKGNEIKSNFFVNSDWFSRNNDKVIKLIEENHNIGNLSNNLDYQNSTFMWMDTIIKKIGKQKNGFCYKTEDIKDLEICAANKNYTINPSIIVNAYPLIEVKEKLESGSIIAFKVNNTVEKELELIIKYIYSKDLKIVNLLELIEE